MRVTIDTLCDALPHVPRASQLVAMIGTKAFVLRVTGPFAVWGPRLDWDCDLGS
jgi:hypothetical protein